MRNRVYGVMVIEFVVRGFGNGKPNKIGLMVCGVRLWAFRVRDSDFNVKSWGFGFRVCSSLRVYKKLYIST